MFLQSLINLSSTAVCHPPRLSCQPESSQWLRKIPMNWTFFLTAPGKFSPQPPSWPVCQLLRNTVSPKQNYSPCQKKGGVDTTCLLVLQFGLPSTLIFGKAKDLAFVCGGWRELQERKVLRVGSSLPRLCLPDSQETLINQLFDNFLHFPLRNLVALSSWPEGTEEKQDRE